ncbi:hypothetical protein ACPCBX_13615 [Streptomyces tuirus]|uniref:Uncharacterized protein n=1 Tax=Streptomyces tuirus TaxID=68278 RepID=A0A7G1NGV6_9ACTN|nr:hypothetical protein [Streptomyces tuirus]BCL20295.1 hypothetical protein GCM10017668_21380 [Streptomyces tuirus]
MITFDNDTGKARKAVKAAQRRGLPIPDEIPATAAMVDVVANAAHMKPPELPTLDDIPATPEELAALIEERAHQQRIALAHQAVGNDFLEPIARKFNALVRDQVPLWIRALRPEFNGLIKQLRTQSKKLPTNLDTRYLNWNDAAVTTPWEKAEGIAFQLDQIVNDRKDMAQAGSLAGEGGRDYALYAVAKLPEPTVEGVVQHRMRTHISPEVAQWRDLRQQPVSRWLALARSEHLTIELATPDEVRQRAAVWDQWREGIAARGVAPLPTPKSIAAIESALRG